jgi:putative ABC transport system permease protein
MLGIIIGIGSVILITSVGLGFQESVQSDFASLGMDSLYVTVKTDKDIASDDLLTLKDCDLIAGHPNVKFVAPSWQISIRVPVASSEEMQQAVLVSTNDDYRFVNSIELEYGRFLSSQDVANGSRVAVIDSQLSKKVFGRSNSVGEKIDLKLLYGTEEATVIGVVKSEELSAVFALPAYVYMPITTVFDIYGSERVDVVFFMLADKDQTSQTALAVNKMLELSHGNSDKYNVQELMESVETIYRVMGYITAFVSLVGGVSLLVGGIGVMNIMLVTVTERTREIGIRKALGATSRNIAFQFLVEAVILTGIGGLIGMTLGYAGAFLAGTYVGFLPAFSLPIIVGTLGVATVIGLSSGVYPALKAARLDPIEALRYE